MKAWAGGGGCRTGSGEEEDPKHPVGHPHRGYTAGPVSGNAQQMGRRIPGLRGEGWVGQALPPFWVAALPKEMGAAGDPTAGDPRKTGPEE